MLAKMLFDQNILAFMEHICSLAGKNFIYFAKKD